MVVTPLKNGGLLSELQFGPTFSPTHSVGLDETARAALGPRPVLSRRNPISFSSAESELGLTRWLLPSFIAELGFLGGGPSCGCRA